MLRGVDIFRPGLGLRTVISIGRGCVLQLEGLAWSWEEEGKWIGGAEGRRGDEGVQGSIGKERERKRGRIIWRTECRKEGGVGGKGRTRERTGEDVLKKREERRD